MYTLFRSAQETVRLILLVENLFRARGCWGLQLNTSDLDRSGVFTCCSEKVSQLNLPWITRKKLPSICNLTGTENYLKNYPVSTPPAGTVRSNIAGSSVQPRYDVTTHIHIEDCLRDASTYQHSSWTMNTSLRISLHLQLPCSVRALLSSTTIVQECKAVLKKERGLSW